MIAGEKEITGRQGKILAACLIKVDHEGNALWEKTYGVESAGAFHAVCRARDGGYALAGKKESSGGGYDIYLVKTDKNGDPLWEKTIPGSGFNCGYSIVPANGGGYVLAGTKGVEKSSRCDIFLLQLEEMKEKERTQSSLKLYAGIIVTLLVALIFRLGLLRSRRYFCYRQRWG
jgi:hypothetical protein